MFRMEDVSNFSPAMAVPITVKIPDPMTAPMPSAVRDHGPSVFLRLCSGASESRISLSIDFLAKTCVGRIQLLQYEASVAVKGLSREAKFARQTFSVC